MFTSNRGRRAARLAIFCSACALVSVAHAAEPIPQLLETGWKASSENYTAALQQYEQHKAAAANDPRAPLAIALVSLKNHKTDDALKYLSQSIATSGSTLDATSLAARRLKIYLDVFRKDATSAQADIRALAQQLATDDPIAPKPESKQAAEWLGGVLGYLAGPGAENNFPLKADAVQAELLTSLKGPLANSLVEGRAAAQRQFEQLKQLQAKARAEIKEKQAANRADDIKKTEAQKAQIADKLKKLEDPNAKDTAATGKKDAKDTEAAQKKAQEIQFRMAQLAQAIQQESKKVRRNDQLMMRMNSELTMLQQQAGNMGFSPDQQLMQQQEEKKKANIEAERKKLQNQENQIATKLKQLAAATDNQTPSTAVDSKLAAFLSYAPIDLEQEKQRIVTSYGSH